MEIKDKAGVENVIVNHLSRLIVESHTAPIDDAFPYEHVLAISMGQAPQFVDFANYLASGIFPHDFSSHQKTKFLHDIQMYF